jgi:hypothetical protein
MSLGLRMGRLKLPVIAGGAGAVMLAATGFAAVPAAAAVRPGETSGPTITHMICEGGNWNGLCYVEWTGGTAPYTVAWTPEGDFFGTSVSTDSAEEYSEIEGSCVAGGDFEAIATVTDADGLSALAGSSAQCDA